LFGSENTGFSANPFGFLDFGKGIVRAPAAFTREFEQNAQSQPERVSAQGPETQIAQSVFNLIDGKLGDFATPKTLHKPAKPVLQIFVVALGKSILLLCLEQLLYGVLDQFAFPDVFVMSGVGLGSLGQRYPKWSQDLKRSQGVTALLGRELRCGQAVVVVPDIGRFEGGECFSFARELPFAKSAAAHFRRPQPPIGAPVLVDQVKVLRATVRKSGKFAGLRIGW